MNEMVMGNANISTVQVNRTPDLIAAEINSIKEQTRKMVLYNSIEIGRRLVEAKSMIDHGQWAKWLENSVDYSQRTANNLMRIFEEYGANQIAFFDNNANSQALANLSYTQAVALLGIPDADEREEFIKDHDIDNMSTRELQQAIKEREQALTEKKELELKLEKAIKESEVNKSLYDSVKKQLSEAQEAGNKEKVETLQKSLDEAEKDLTEQANRIEELEQQLKEKPIEAEAATVIEKVPEEVEKELNELRKKVAQQNNPVTLKFSAYFDVLVKGFKDLLGTLAEIKEIDPAEHERYKNAVSGLIGKMSERL